MTTAIAEEEGDGGTIFAKLLLGVCWGGVCVILTLIFFFKIIIKRWREKKNVENFKSRMEWKIGRLIARVLAAIIYREKSCVIQNVGRN